MLRSMEYSAQIENAFRYVEAARLGQLHELREGGYLPPFSVVLSELSSECVGLGVRSLLSERVREAVVLQSYFRKIQPGLVDVSRYYLSVV